MLNVKHEDGKIWEVLGYETEKEMHDAVDSEESILGGELKVFLSVYQVAGKCKALSSILNAVTGLDLDRPSEVAEYVVKSLPKEEDRKALVIDLMATEIMDRAKGGDLDLLMKAFDLRGKK